MIKSPVTPAMFVASIIAGIVLAGCAPEKSVSTTPKSGSSGGVSTTPEPAASNDNNTVTNVGEWAHAEDGVDFRVSKLARGRIGEYAAGGRPGSPAVVVTVQIRNGSKQRLDLTLGEVIVRLGEDGRQAEQVFDEGFGGSPNGSLAPGRTNTHRYMFAAEAAAELRKVAVEVNPGLEYGSITFEGAV